MLKPFKLALTDQEIALLESLNSPEKVQAFIDTEIKYNSEREDRTIVEVIRDRKAECFNGALFAVACLTLAGFKASIIRLYARAGDEEHVLCVYRYRGYYGSVAQSKFLGLKSRQPIYRTVRDLAVSYVEFYFGFDGRYSLQSYTQLLPISKYNFSWLNHSDVVTKMANDLNAAKHYELVKLTDPYYFVEPQRYWNEILVIPNGTKIPAAYLKYHPKHFLSHKPIKN